MSNEVEAQMSDEVEARSAARPRAFVGGAANYEPKADDRDLLRGVVRLVADTAETDESVRAALRVANKWLARRPPSVVKHLEAIQELDLFDDEEAGLRPQGIKAADALLAVGHLRVV